MSIYIQSQEDETLYFNGTILDKKGYDLALFGPIDNARIFNTTEEATQVSELFSVPVNIVEV